MGKGTIVSTNILQHGCTVVNLHSNEYKIQLGRFRYNRFGSLCYTLRYFAPVSEQPSFIWGKYYRKSWL
jgi:hypothetical protein